MLPLTTNGCLLGDGVSGRKDIHRIQNAGHIYRLLNNRIYIGEIALKGRSYPGEHEGIIDRATWDKVQVILEDNKPVKLSMARTKMVDPLKGFFRCGHCGCSTGPTYAHKTVIAPQTTAGSMLQAWAQNRWWFQLTRFRVPVFPF